MKRKEGGNQRKLAKKVNQLDKWWNVLGKGMGRKGSGPLRHLNMFEQVVASFRLDWERELVHTESSYFIKSY